MGRKQGEYLAGVASPSSSLMKGAAAGETTSRIRRTLERQVAVTSMLVILLLVPEMHLTRKPLAVANGKQDTVQRGPYRRTQATRWRRR